MSRKINSDQKDQSVKTIIYNNNNNNKNNNKNNNN